MPSDYGDESGEKMLDNFTRFGERMGEEAMRNRADKLHDAFEHAKARASEKGAPWNEPSEWAKLDMHEFREIEGYGEVKRIIESKMAARGVDTTWFEDKENDREYLLFRIADAQDVWRGFDELAMRLRAPRSAPPRTSSAKSGGNATSARSTSARNRRAGHPISCNATARHAHASACRGPGRQAEMTAPNGKAVAATAALSVAAFAFGNCYAACLLSLPGQPTSNLTAALAAMPAFVQQVRVSCMRARAPWRPACSRRARCGPLGRAPSRTGQASVPARSTGRPGGRSPGRRAGSPTRMTPATT
jgi:hypothetical protein